MQSQNRPPAEINLLFKWAKYKQSDIPELATLHNIPRGVKAGVPNIFWPLPRGIYHGLYIYIFTSGVETRYSQNTWIEMLTKAGYKVVVTENRIQAKEQILSYYNLINEKTI
jgi:hypothetical protein